MRRLAPTLALFVPLLTAAPGLAQRGPEAPAVDRGVAYLRGASNGLNVGESALVALTLSKNKVPPSDPTIQVCMSKVLARFTPEGYAPEKRGGHDNYEAAVVCMALTQLDPLGFKPQIDAVAKYLIAAQKGGGGWDYVDRTAGDTSMSQYVILALWDAESVGVEVPPRLWDSAASWFLRTQTGAGGWTYHPDETQWRETVSMTAAGVGSILICKQQLDRYRKGIEVLNPLLIPLLPEGAPQTNFRPTASPAAMNSAVRRGLDWLQRNYQVSESDLIGLTAYYGLYGMERTGALAAHEKISTFDWYGPGLRFVLSTQKGDGSWDSRQYGPHVNTCWAILFAAKATEEMARKIDLRRLGAGTLLGGRGLPTDLNNLAIADGRVVVKPMNGAIESMLAVLEDPNADNVDAALAGLLARYQATGPPALRPFKDRFRKLAEDRDPGLRRVACWGLARTADLDVVPVLIRTLLDPDDEVVAEARVGLQMLSRKVDGFGPARGATAEQKKTAAVAWRDWYESIRTPGMEPLDVATLRPRFRAPDPPPPTQGEAGAAAGAGEEESL